MSDRQKLDDLRQLRELNEKLIRNSHDFINKWKGRPKENFSASDLVQFNLEWLELSACKECLDKEARRLGVNSRKN